MIEGGIWPQVNKEINPLFLYQYRGNRQDFPSIGFCCLMTWQVNMIGNKFDELEFFFLIDLPRVECWPSLDNCFLFLFFFTQLTDLTWLTLAVYKQALDFLLLFSLYQVESITRWNRNRLTAYGWRATINALRRMGTRGGGGGGR